MGITEYVEKPFIVTELARLIRKILDAEVDAGQG
jgi:DNA-binding response OmpR family regulator